MLDVNKTSCWYNIKLEVLPALKKDWKFPEVPKNNNHIWRFTPEEVLDPEWIKMSTEKLGFKWRTAMVFWKAKGYTSSRAHIDLYDSGATVNYGLNFVIGGEGSEMIWFSPPETTVESPRTPAGTRVALLQISELKELERHALGDKFTLVRTGIPHEVTGGNTDRWCFSLRPELPQTSWEDIVRHLKDRGMLE